MAHLLVAQTLTLPLTPTKLQNLITTPLSKKQKYSICLSVLDSAELHVGTSTRAEVYSIHPAGERINWVMKSLGDMHLSGTGTISINIFWGE